MEPTQSKGQTYIHIILPNTLDRGKALVGLVVSEVGRNQFGGGHLTPAESTLMTGKKANHQTGHITKLSL